MIIAQITDTHLMDPAYLESVGEAEQAAQARQRLANLRACVDDINAMHAEEGGIDAVIFTGDMVQHARAEEYAVARAEFERLTPPLHIAPGNRDHRDRLRAAFAPLGAVPAGGGPIDYAVEAYAVRLVCVDSLSDTSMMGAFNADRLAAIDAMLRARPSKPTALFLHHPPFDVLTASPERRFQYETRDAADGLAVVLEKHPQVIHLFTGHSHRAFDSRVGGVKATTAPSVAADLRQDPYPDALKHEPVYQVHRLVETFDGGHTKLEFVSETRVPAAPWAIPAAAE